MLSINQLSDSTSKISNKSYKKSAGCCYRVGNPPWLGTMIFGTDNINVYSFQKYKMHYTQKYTGHNHQSFFKDQAFSIQINNL